MDIKILAENMRRFNTKNLQEQEILTNPNTRSTEIGGVTFTPPEKKPNVFQKIKSKLQSKKSAFVDTGMDMLNNMQEILSATMGFKFNLYSVAPGNLATNGNNPMITGFTLTNMGFKNGKAKFDLVCKNPLTSTTNKVNARLDWDSNKPNQFSIYTTDKQGLGFKTNPAVVYNEKFSAALMTEFNKLRNDSNADFSQNSTGAPTNNIA